jgi:hypothetical protein
VRNLDSNIKGKLKVCQNRVLRRILGSKMIKIIGVWRKLHNEKLHNLHSSPNKIILIKLQRNKWAMHVECMGRREMHMGFWWDSQKKPVGRPRFRWEDNIKTDLREIGWGDIDWIYQAQDRYQCRALVNTVMNVPVP